MVITKDSVLELLQDIKDPEIPHISIIELGMINNISISDKNINIAEKKLLEARPTAVDLKWAISKVKEKIFSFKPRERFEVAWMTSGELAENSIKQCSKIGDFGK